METIKTIDYLEQLNYTTSGNPRYRIHFTDGTVLVSHSNAAFVYGLTNPEYRDVPVRVELTRAGRVADISLL